MASEKYETRSVRETASETAGLSIAILFIISLLIFSTVSGNDGPAVLKSMVSAGEVVYAHLGWTLTVYITVLLAFYAVSIGGQVLGGPNAAARTRRVLGFVAELMAAATLVLVVFVAFYCWQNPTMWAVAVVLVPVVGIVIFLALQLGSFVVLDLESRTASARQIRDQTHERLKGLNRRSRRRFWLVWLVNSAVTAAIALLLTLPAGATGDALVLYGYYLALVVVLLGATLFSLYTFLSSRDAVTRVIIWMLPALLYVGVGVLPFNAFVATGESRLSAWVGWAFVVVIVLTLVTTFLPRTRGSRLVLDWSMQGTAARLAARSLTKKYAKAVRTYRGLQVLPTASPGLLQRLRDALRPPVRVG